MVKYCPKCGTKVPDEGISCPNCGADLRNVKDAKRRNPFSDVDDVNRVNSSAQMKNGIRLSKSQILIILFLVFIGFFIVSTFLMGSPSGGISSDDNYNISYKAIYLSGKGTANQTDAYFANETIFEGVHYDYLDRYNVTLNDGEWYEISISEIKIVEGETSDDFNDSVGNLTTYEDMGLEYPVPCAIKSTDYREVEDGKSIRYSYMVCISCASHYKYVSTEFLESIIYSQDY